MDDKPFCCLMSVSTIVALNILLRDLTFNYIFLYCDIGAKEEETDEEIDGF